jgi:hypothetical protein
MLIMAFLVPEHGLGQGLAELGLAHPVGAQEQEGADGPLGVLSPTRPADGPADGGHGLVLADDPLVEDVLHLHQARALVLRQAGDGHARPAGDHLGDVLGIDGAVCPAPAGLPVPAAFSSSPRCSFSRSRSSAACSKSWPGWLPPFQRPEPSPGSHGLELVGHGVALHPHPGGGLVPSGRWPCPAEADVDIAGGHLHGGVDASSRWSACGGPHTCPEAPVMATLSSTRARPR